MKEERPEESPPTGGANGTDFGKLFLNMAGARWFLLLSSGLVLLGVILFVRYGMDRGWLPATLILTVGAVAGLGAWFWAESLLKRGRALSGLLTWCGGFLLAWLSLWGLAGLSELSWMPRLAAVLVLAAVATAAAGRGMAHRSLPMMLVAVIALAASGLVDKAAWVQQLAAAIAVVQLLLVARISRVWWLFPAGYVIFLLFCLYGLQAGNHEPGLPDILLAALPMALHLGFFLASSEQAAARFRLPREIGLVYLLVTTLLSTLLLTALISDMDIPLEWLFWSLAALHLGVGLFRLRAAAAQWVILMALAAGIAGVGIAWGSEAALFCLAILTLAAGVLRQFSRFDGLAFSASLLYAALAVWFLLATVPAALALADEAPILSWYGWLVPGLWLSLAAILLNTPATETYLAQRKDLLSQFEQLPGWMTALALVTLPLATLGDFWPTLVLLVFGVALYAAIVKLHRTRWYLPAVLIPAVGLARLFMVDLQKLPAELSRIIAILLLGVALLTIALIFSRKKHYTKSNDAQGTVLPPSDQEEESKDE